jgi:hypothetical protein
MLDENEVIMLLLGAGILVFTITNRSQIRRIPFSKHLMTAYYLLLAGWVATILEGFFLERYLNFIEHFLYAASAVIVSLWCLKATKNNKEESR